MTKVTDHQPDTEDHAEDQAEETAAAAALRYESGIRITLAGAHRTVASIYDNRELPLLRWLISDSGLAYAFTWDMGHLEDFYGWLDNPQRGSHTTELHDHHWIVGSKEGVPIKVAYIVSLEGLPG